MHDEPMVKMVKPENKLVGFHLRILDDETYLIRTDNKNYEMSKEYSFSNMKDLQKGIEHILEDLGEKQNSDNLEKKKEY